MPIESFSLTKENYHRLNSTQITVSLIAYFITVIILASSVITFKFNSNIQIAIKVANLEFLKYKLLLHSFSNLTRFNLKVSTTMAHFTCTIKLVENSSATRRMLCSNTNSIEKYCVTKTGSTHRALHVLLNIPSFLGSLGKIVPAIPRQKLQPLQHRNPTGEDYIRERRRHRLQYRTFLLPRSFAKLAR